LEEFINRPPSGRGRAGTLNRAWPCGFLIRKLLCEGCDPLQIEAELHAYHRRFAGIAEPADQADPDPVEQVDACQFEDVEAEVQDEEQPVEDEQVALQRRPFEADDSDDESNSGLASYSSSSGPLRSKSLAP